jgi:succinyl-diaminopimelate desuccinylase
MTFYNERGHDVPFVLLCTSDEESGCSGAEAVAESRILEGVKYGVCAEPTSLDVLVGEKGMLWSRVIAHGKAAHGSRPDEGLNAINLCSRAIDALTTHEYSFEPNDLLGRMTTNIGLINGGIKINVVPDHCEASIDMRTVKGQSIEGILEEMNQVLELAELSDVVSIEYIHGKPAVITSETSPIVDLTRDAVESVTGKRTALASATYGTDCSVLQPKIGIQNVICGPGAIEQAHQPNEFISIDQLEKSVLIYTHIAEQMASMN